jgi:hypothetical protein
MLAHVVINLAATNVIRGHMTFVQTQARIFASHFVSNRNKVERPLLSAVDVHRSVASDRHGSQRQGLHR